MTNFVHANPEGVQIGKFVFNVVGHDFINRGAIGLGNIQRKILRVAMGDKVEVNFVHNVSLQDFVMFHHDQKY